MKTLSLATTVALLAACGPKPQQAPRDRYVAALNHRMEGDAKAWFDGLIAVANDAPESRAGRRARATIQGGNLMTTFAIVGVLSAIAIPNFLKFQGRAKQSEAKMNLRGIYTALKAHRAEFDRYCTTFSKCGFEPDSGSRYLYYLSAQEVVGGDAAGDGDLLRLRAESTLAAMGIKPQVAGDEFLVVAVGDPDDDGQLDVWSIDEENNLVNLLDDFE